MKVSVVIPTYNEEKVITECLESLLKQTYKDIEIIVVDDGSTDSTKRLVKEFKEVNLFVQSHKGAGAARNYGVKRAKGDILVFVDADMTFDKNFVKKLVEPVVDNDVIGTFSKEEYLVNGDNIWAKSWNIDRGLPKSRMIPKNYPDTQKVFRAILKTEFRKAKGFDEKAGYTDDWSLSERLGVEAVNAKGAKFYHKNPETLLEVFVQSRWMAKRKYKWGLIGLLAALFRVSLPGSLVFGAIKSLIYLLPFFLVFKIISDFGQFIGILEYYLFGKVKK